ncbi:40-residue YVTN family beta-propeller repeat-containing protein [Micromonospora rhizosphaerae]|uniref:40-residue YVTN family beta-propeller repeat-containing protein n=1 Tax=Micromonospora rhizosphaerae TaxID=568872 RepID=A0A1C6S695_9ACTN|nr:40-residue YVTN family beta-propeller repeat-containing protein [Micromonospora rhizosphaerae]
MAAPSPGSRTPSASAALFGPLLPGMPPYRAGDNVYAGAGPGMLSEAVRGDRALVYVPNTKSNDVWVIDPATYKVVAKFPGGPEPQHVVPSYDLRTLYVASSHIPDGGVVPVDPRTGRPGQFVTLQDVYNLYFTPDGREAIVVAEAYQRLDLYDPRTWHRTRSVRFPQCGGINHMDYSADGKTMLWSCEFANRMLVLDTATLRKLREFQLTRASDGMPQDTRLTPDGRHFLVADMHAHGVYVFDGQATRQTGFIPTGRGAHGIYFSRDGRLGYVTNRDAGTITVLDLATLKPTTTWRIPGGGSPDMGGLSADGRVLWLSGRYHDEVYAFSTADGRLLARIPVGRGPHGLTIWPQPGRYSLGHTANIR